MCGGCDDGVMGRWMDGREGIVLNARKDMRQGARAKASVEAEI